MDEVDADQVRFVVSRRGKAKVVILSVRDYLKNVIKQPGDTLTTIQVSAQKAGLDNFSEAKIDAEIVAIVSPSRSSAQIINPKDFIELIGEAISEK